MNKKFSYIYIHIYSEKILNPRKESTLCDGDGKRKQIKLKNRCAQSTDYLNTSFQMMVMSPAAEPSGCPYVTKLQP